MPVKQTTTYHGGSPIRLDEATMAQYARAYGFGVPVGFLVGMAKRESNWTVNQIDLDYDKDTGDAKTGQETYGLCMVRRSEAIGALSLTAIDTDGLLDPSTNIKVMSTMLARFRTALSAVAQDGYAEDDMLRYLCWAHNAGLGQALKSVRTYGLDWPALEARNYANPGNGYMTTRMIPYANDVLSYVKKYTTVTVDEETGQPEETYEEGKGSDDTWMRVGLLLLVGWAGWAYLFGRPPIGV